MKLLMNSSTLTTKTTVLPLNQFTTIDSNQTLNRFITQKLTDSLSTNMTTLSLDIGKFHHTTMTLTSTHN